MPKTPHYDRGDYDWANGRMRPDVDRHSTVPSPVASHGPGKPPSTATAPHDVRSSPNMPASPRGLYSKGGTTKRFTSTRKVSR